MKRNRQDRRKDFDDFFENAEDIFKVFLENDERVTSLQNAYNLNIVPGSRKGKNNKRIVEVFWGSRLFEVIANGRVWTSLTEYGSTLLYECDDTGHINISIYPAYTVRRRPIENRIELNIWIDSKKLKSKRFLKQNWNDFISYMECTSLDGNPNIIQRLRIFYLRNFKYLVINNIWTPPRSSTFYKTILKYVLTVGLSGFILLMLTTMCVNPSAKEANIQHKVLTKQVENISKKLDKIIINNKNENEKTVKIKNK